VSRDGGEARSVKTRMIFPDVLFADPTRVLFTTQKDVAPDDRRWSLWCLDTETGRERFLMEEERIWMLACGGLHIVSPSGDDVAFVAGPEDAKRVYTLTLADLSIRLVDTGAGPSDVGSVRFREDGLLVLTGRRAKSDQKDDAVLWAAHANGSGIAQAWKRRGGGSDHALSPGGRWTVGPLEGQMVITDLMRGEQRPVAASDLSDLSQVRGLSSESAFAYVVGSEESGSIVIVEWATGEEKGRVEGIGTSRESFTVSPTGRFLAHAVKDGWLTYVRIVEVTTGRHVTLRQPFTFFFGPDMSFSPDERFLAVERTQLGSVARARMVQIIDLRAW